MSDNSTSPRNIFFGREPFRFGMIIKRGLIARPGDLDMVGLNVSPRTIVGSRPIGKQKLVEIAKVPVVRTPDSDHRQPTS